MEAKRVTYKNVDEYIAGQPEVAIGFLEQLRELIKKLVPEAEEMISYGMPAYRYYGMLVYFGCHTGHYAIYGNPGVTAMFKEELKGYEQSKGTIRFSYDKPLPKALITKIIKARIEDNIERHKKKGKK